MWQIVFPKDGYYNISHSMCLFFFFWLCNIDVSSIGWWGLRLLPVNLGRPLCPPRPRTYSGSDSMWLWDKVTRNSCTSAPCSLGTTALGTKPPHCEETKQLHGHAVCRCSGKQPQQTANINHRMWLSIQLTPAPARWETASTSCWCHTEQRRAVSDNPSPKCRSVNKMTAIILSHQGVLYNWKNKYDKLS